MCPELILGAKRWNFCVYSFFIMYPHVRVSSCATFIFFFVVNIQTTFFFVGCFMTYKTKPNHQELVMERANLKKIWSDTISSLGFSTSSKGWAINNQSYKQLGLCSGARDRNLTCAGEWRQGEAHPCSKWGIPCGSAHKPEGKSRPGHCFVSATKKKN